MCISRQALKGKKYLFRDIHNFSFSAKIPNPAEVAKTEIFPLSREYCCTTLWVKNSLEIALSLTISKIFSMFYFPLNSKMAAKWQKLKFFPFGYDTLVLPCGSNIHSKLLYLVWFSRYSHFFISAKIQDGRQK